MNRARLAAAEELNKLTAELEAADPAEAPELFEEQAGEIRARLTAQTPEALQEDFGLVFDEIAIGRRQRVRADATARLRAQGVAELDDAHERQLRLAAAAEDEEDAAVYLGLYEESVDEAVAAGTIDARQAQARKQSFREAFTEVKVMQGIRANPCHFASVVNLNLKDNHFEHDAGPLLELECSGSAFINRASIKGNHFFAPVGDAVDGIRITGSDFRNLEISENYFVRMHSAIDASRSAASNTIRIVNNHYADSTVQQPIQYSYLFSNKEVGRGMFVEADDEVDNVILRCKDGRFEIEGISPPTTGRYKAGTRFYWRASSANQVDPANVVVFDGDREGFLRVDARSDTADAVASTNTVTPVDITKFASGDRITIAGADTAGADLTCQVRTIDYGAGTFTTDPSIKTDVTAANVTFATGTWKQVLLTGSKTYDPPSISAGSGVTTTVTVTGAALGDFVEAVSFDQDLQDIILTAWVSAADTVSARFRNGTAGAIDLASGMLRVRVRKA